MNWTPPKKETAGSVLWTLVWVSIVWIGIFGVLYMWFGGGSFIEYARIAFSFLFEATILGYGVIFAFLIWFVPWLKKRKRKKKD